jgi:hypothetical protein
MPKGLIADHHRPELPVRRCWVTDGRHADAAGACHQQIVTVTGGMFPFPQRLRKTRKPPPIFSAALDLRNGAIRIAKSLPTLWLSEPLNAIAPRLFQCHRANTAVRAHGGQAMRAAIGVDRTGIIARRGRRGKTQAEPERDEQQPHRKLHRHDHGINERRDEGACGDAGTPA